MTEEGELPEGWTRYPLESLLEPGGLFDGPFGSNLKTSDYTESGVRVVRLENLSNLRFNEEKRTYVSREKYQSLEKHTVRTGDLLFGSFLDDAVRVAMLPELPTPAIAKADCFCIRTRRDLVDSRFLMYRLGATETKDALIEDIHGATRPRVTTRQLRALRIGLPLVSEQVRIAARIEVALASVTGASERLSGAGSVLKRLRRSTLAAACDGRLTEDWRHNRGESDDWPTVDLESVAEGFSYGSAAKSSPTGRVPVLRMGNIQAGLLDWSDLVYTSDTKEIAKYRLAPGDVLFNRTNSPELVGKTAVYRGERLAIYAGYLIRIRCSPKLLPDFLNYSLNGPAGREYLASVRTDGVSQSNINARSLAAFEFGLPSISEQHEIVRRVEALFALADAIEKRVAGALSRADMLTQAILAKAFRGELVPTEAELNRRRETTNATPPPVARPTTARPARRRSR